MNQIKNSTERDRFEDCEIGDYVLGGSEICDPAPASIQVCGPDMDPDRPGMYFVRYFVRVFTDKSLMIAAWQRSTEAAAIKVAIKASRLATPPPLPA